MKHRKSVKSCFVLLLAFVLVLVVSRSVAEETFYGITSTGTLISIDTSNANVNVVGDTDLLQPTGLTYNSKNGLLYACTYNIGLTGAIYSIEPETAEATLFTSPGDGQALGYGFVDDVLYSTNLFSLGTFIETHKLDYSWDILGAVEQTVQGLAVRPSDGVLFGTGFNSFNANALFTIDITGQSDPLDTEIAETNHHIMALAFLSDGRLYGSDGPNLLRIDTSTGNVTIQHSFGGHTVTGLAVVTLPVPGPVDVWMKDCVDDIGDAPSVPAPCEVAYKSPDIWIDNNGDMIIDQPVIGEENILRAKVRNRESGSAQNVSVKFYYRDNTTGLYFPTGATFIGEDTVTVPPNGTALASVMWNVPAPPSTGGHWCIGVLLSHPDDPLPDPPPHAQGHNNIAMANIWFIAGREGEQELMSFNVGTGGKSGFGLTPWPRKFIIKVDDNLPTGWNWTMEGVPVGAPFTLKLGEERQAKLKVDVAEGAAPHSGGSIEVLQVDVDTDMVVGGLSYNLYEDHRPPEKVRAVRASIVDTFAVLTWDEVFKESETGLRERVAYYEVLRNGKAVDKVLRDGDPHQPGIQWTDATPVQGSVAYSVRVVDEGGNISEASTEVKLKAPGGFCNWLTWLLLILVVILLVIIVLRRQKT